MMAVVLPQRRPLVLITSMLSHFQLPATLLFRLPVYRKAPYDVPSHGCATLTSRNRDYPQRSDHHHSLFWWNVRKFRDGKLQ